MSLSRPPTKHEITALNKKRDLLLAKQREFRDGLPHLYGHKWYWWQRQFFESRNLMRLMTCANQVGKSTVHHWDKIERATNIALWPELWPLAMSQGLKPNLFWYFYTDQDTCNREYALKWKLCLPRNEMKDHPQYGWNVQASKQGREIHGIEFNSGVVLEFKMYTQNPKNLQGATVFDLGSDEEMPEPFFDEVMQRMSAIDGHFSSAFTATLGQQMWWRAMEGKGEAELFKDAFKLQVSKYECLTFDDGSPGLYTVERIEKQKALCTSQAQIDRRIMGRFATEAGRKYPTFCPDRHYIAPRPIPKDWTRYAGVDIGSGETRHPGAYFMIAVDPDCRLGYVYNGRRLDDVGTTTAGDVLNHYVETRAGDDIAVQKYDGHCKDFGTIADRAGEPFTPADKAHDLGEGVLNTLFANDMLLLFDIPEVNKLGQELLTLMRDTDKRKAVDDATDALRYGAVAVPWDFSAIQGKPADKEPEVRLKPLTREEIFADDLRRAREGLDAPPRDGWQEMREEIAVWNDIGGYGDD